MPCEGMVRGAAAERANVESLVRAVAMGARGTSSDVVVDADAPA